MKKLKIKLSASEWQDLDAALMWYIAKAQTEHKTTGQLIIFYIMIELARKNSLKLLFYREQNLLLTPHEAIALYTALTEVEVIAIQKIRSIINQNFIELR